MQTAARLFYQNGYSNTGINQIIEVAGIAKSSLYQHFRSKEDLLIAYLEETGTEIYTLFEGALISNMVYEGPWPVISARNIVEKIN
jgi:AcrR family transcriptional regulator